MSALCGPFSFAHRTHVLRERHFIAQLSVRQSAFAPFYAPLILLASLAYVPYAISGAVGSGVYMLCTCRSILLR